ncbi:MAG: MarR family transcriptional regulator [Gammaproteobacteria bacterium]|jgi:predicted ArsR family transcriptional regulator|nr:MarR family transcriptional regulator [Gammaproteobacteria bacterium]
MDALTHLPKTQAQLARRLKVRGAQSIKILAAQLQLTTMGVRQHLVQLQDKGYAKHAQTNRQTRGRPVTLWKLTEAGHRLFGDTHARLAVTLIEGVSETFGEAVVGQLADTQAAATLAEYRALLPDPAEDLNLTLAALCQQRSDEGFMAELRFTPSGWLLIENHCPIFAAASRCNAFCGAELQLFTHLLAPHAQIERSDHVLAGARRCAYRIQRSGTPKTNHEASA